MAMLLLDINKVSVAFGNDFVLRNCSLRVNEGERIGLIGQNGEGKTTLLETIQGRIRHDSGSVILPSYIKTAYLKQKQDLSGAGTLHDEMMNVFSEVLDSRRRLREIEIQMREEADNGQLLIEYGRLLDKYEVFEGDSIERKVEETLEGVGFGKDEFGKLMSDLSGGQKNRAALAGILLSGADLLLLDEPTNHLDLDAIEFLENYLNSFPGGAIIISHDRTFLDNVVTSVAEIEKHKLHVYPGVHYSGYLPLKVKDVELQTKIHKRQREEIERQKEFIRRNIVGQKTKLAQSRRRMLRKMELIDKPITPDSRMRPVIGDIKRSGLNVLEINNLYKSYDAAVVLNDVTFKLERGEAAGIIGPNACGKTTLLKVISGILKPDSGEVKIGGNISIGYFAQHREEINYSRTILDQIWDLAPDWEEVRIRSYLGRFLFTGDEPLRIAGSLSGGEIARLALAMLFLHRHNFLLLDEPTNHLDIASREVLEDTLSEFPGTLLIISHDRYFLNNLVDKIYSFENNQLVYYAGNFDYYLEKREQSRDISPRELIKDYKERQRKSLKSYLESKQRSRKRQKLKKIEAEIELLESKISEHKAIMDNEEYASDWEKLESMGKELEAMEHNLEKLFKQWEQVHNRI